MEVTTMNTNTLTLPRACADCNGGDMTVTLHSGGVRVSCSGCTHVNDLSKETWPQWQGMARMFDLGQDTRVTVAS